MRSEAEDHQLIRCKRPGCGQVLARRYPSGDVRPVVQGEFIDKYGKLTVRCPACGTRQRMPDIDETVRTA